MHCPRSALAWLSLPLTLADTHPLTVRQPLQNATLPVDLLYQYPPTAWVENLAVRPNGLILPITTTSPLLNQLDPLKGTVALVNDFSAHGNAIQGITEVTPDVFAVNVLTCNITALTCKPGSVTTWLVDFCDRTGEHRGLGNTVSVRKIAAFPSAGFLNGMAALDYETVLIADSYLGGIWSLNVYTGLNRLLFTDRSMKPTKKVATGINGLRVRQGSLYFTNSAKGTFNRLPIDPTTGGKTGNAEVIASGLSGPDDLEIDAEAGVAYVCNGAANEVLRVSLNGGETQVVAKIPGPTSVRWTVNRGHVSRKDLYISDVGGLLQYVEQNVTLGGAVYGIEL